MEHTEAVETMAAERYLLGELLPEDRDAFEEHFFDCTECTASVRAGATLIAGIRADAADERDETPAEIAEPPQNVVPLRSHRPSPMRWLPLAASVLLAAGLAFQTVHVERLAAENTQLRHQHAAPAGSGEAAQHFLTLGARGGEEDVAHIDGKRPFALAFDLPDDLRGDRCSVAIADAAGRNVFTELVPVKRGESMVVPMAGGVLAPGRYSLIVNTEPAGSPRSVPFDVQ
jgi:hypothetical protein